MKNVLLYWNHICILHKQEKAHLERLAQRLLTEGISLDIRYFGMGYPMHLSEYLAKEEAILPDILVSADLEVFEDPRIFQRFSSSLLPAAQWLTLRKSEALKAIWRNEALLPILSIPLVYYTREPEYCQNQLFSEIPGLAIGGINNSVIKTAVKALWERRGKTAAVSFLENCQTADMPIGAYGMVRQKKATTALVPSLYALRANGQDSFLEIPSEGPMLLPSFLAARNTLSQEVAQIVANGILSPELCEFYAKNGDLIMHIEGFSGHSRQEASCYFTPSASWLSTLDPREFDDLYRKKLPQAKLNFNYPL
ncbi:MAG: hypothetical protein ACI4V0_10480 [Lachnospiraceae bacterium]